MQVSLKACFGNCTVSALRPCKASTRVSTSIFVRQRTYPRRIDCTQNAEGDLSREAEEKALAYQLRQTTEKKDSSPLEEPKPFKKVVKEKEEDPEDSSRSFGVQSSLADRVGAIVDEQMRDAIQRQVGATRADWADALESEQQAEETAEGVEETKVEEKPKSSSKAPVRTFPDGSVLYTDDQF